MYSLDIDNAPIRSGKLVASYFFLSNALVRISMNIYDLPFLAMKEKERRKNLFSLDHSQAGSSFSVSIRRTTDGNIHLASLPFSGFLLPLTHGRVSI